MKPCMLFCSSLGSVLLASLEVDSELIVTIILNFCSWHDLLGFVLLHCHSLYGLYLLYVGIPRPPQYSCLEWVLSHAETQLLNSTTRENMSDGIVSIIGYTFNQALCLNLQHLRKGKIIARIHNTKKKHTQQCWLYINLRFMNSRESLISVPW